MIYVLVFIALFILELIYFKIANRFNIIDKPNERSSHTQITLRGGGIVFYFSTCCFFILSGLQYPFFFIGLSAITVVSFFDDVFTLSNRIRLLVQLIAVLLMFYQWNLFDISLLWIFPTLIVVIGIINAYNFMDGINGITVCYSISVLLLLLFANNNEVSYVNNELIIYALIGTGVFGFFNFRAKAKAFAGDVGSVSMAFIVIFLLGALIITSGNFIYILFLVVYGLDTIWTIIGRLAKKENIFQAHRSHLYQYLSNEVGVNKLFVALLYGVVQFLIGLIVLKLVKEPWMTQMIVSFGIVALLSIGYILLKNYCVRKFAINK